MGNFLVSKTLDKIDYCIKTVMKKRKRGKEWTISKTLSFNIAI